MKRKITTIITCLSMSVLLCISVVFAGSPYAEGASKAKKIIMNQSFLNMKTGDTFKLKVKKVKPAKAGKAVKYRSAKKQIATVSPKGVVKAKSKGKTNIIVTSKKDKSLKTVVTVKVKLNKSEDEALTGSTPAPVQSDVPTPTVSPAPVVTEAPPTPTPVPDDGRVFKNTSEIYADIISEQFKTMLPQKNGDIIAIDLKDCKSLADDDGKLLADTLSSKYGETVIKTREELVEAGKITDDDTHKFVFNGGVLITIRENASDSKDITFDIQCTKTGLNAIFFKDCKIVQKDGGWRYELGVKGLS